MKKMDELSEANVPTVPALPESAKEDYARGMALLVNTSHERDQAIKQRDEAFNARDSLGIELAGVKEQVAILRSQITRDAEFAKLTETQHQNQIATFQSQLAELTKANAAELVKLNKLVAEADSTLNAIASVVLTKLQERGVEIAERKVPVPVDMSAVTTNGNPPPMWLKPDDRLS